MLNSERQPENEFTSFCQAQTNAVHFCQTKPIKRKHSHAPCFRHTIFRLPFSAAKGSLAPLSKSLIWV